MRRHLTPSRAPPVAHIHAVKLVRHVRGRFDRPRGAGARPARASTARCPAMSRPSASTASGSSAATAGSRSRLTRRPATGGGRDPVPAEIGTDAIFRVASLSKLVAAALTLSVVADGIVALDEPVATWLPELASPRVLTRIDGPLTDTVPATRPILVADLLTMTCGFGLVLARGPLFDAFKQQGLMPGPFAPPFSGDEFMRRLGALPLAIDPGSGWLYHTGIDALSVLLARAAGRPVSELLQAADHRAAADARYGVLHRSAAPSDDRVPPDAGRPGGAGPSARAIQPPAPVRGVRLGPGLDGSGLPVVPGVPARRRRRRTQRRRGRR